MSTLAAATARETAFTFGGGMLHGIAPGAIDGFAVGALATVACCLIVAGLRLLHGTRRSRRDGMPSGSRHSKVQRDYLTAPIDAGPAPAAVSPAAVSPATLSPATLSPATANPAKADAAAKNPGEPGEPSATMAANLFAPEAEVLCSSPSATSELHEVSADGYRYGPELAVDPFGAVDSSDVILPGTGANGIGRDRPGRSGYRCKHRVTSNDAARRPDARRQPRHAAPTARRATRMSGKFTAFPLVARN